MNEVEITIGKIFLKKACQNKNLIYICTRKQRNTVCPNDPPYIPRAISSAGSEHLPYKQGVGSSNLSSPTNPRGLLFNTVGLFCC